MIAYTAWIFCAACARCWSHFTTCLFGRDIGNGVLNTSLLFGFGTPGTFSLVLGGWSIGVEVVVYMIFPFPAMVIKRILPGIGLPFVILGTLVPAIILALTLDKYFERPVRGIFRRYIFATVPV